MGVTEHCIPEADSTLYNSLEVNQSNIVIPDIHCRRFGTILDMMSAAMYKCPDICRAMSERKKGIVKHVALRFFENQWLSVIACPTSLLSTLSRYIFWCVS